jgi:hypothetical protein
MTFKKAVLYRGVLCIAAYFLLGCEQMAGPVTKTGTGPDTETGEKSTVAEFTVTVDPNLSYGAITVEPPKAAEGAEITLTVTPHEDYYLEEGYPVLMDAEGGEAASITGDPETLVFAFPMPARNVLVSASFAKIPNGLYAITIDPSITNGTVTASAAESKERKTITVILAPDPQMQFHSGSLKVNNGTVKVSGSKTRYTFTMPARDVVISAEFKPPNNIDTAEKFLQIGRTAEFPLDEIYEINADITISNWTPPDSEKTPFTGVIYGQGKTITLESFSSSALSDAPHLGVFAYLRSAVIQDLTIIGASAPFNATSAQYCGLLAGYAQGAELKNIAVAGTLDITRTSGILYVAGLAGYMQGGSLENDPACGKSSVSVTGKTTAGTVYGGGMVGYAKDVTTISGIHTTGNVTVTGEGHNTSAGGFSAYSYASKISGCSATGNISVVADAHGAKDDSHLYMTYAGGLVGQSVSSGATITKSYATGTAYAQSPYPYAGGLCGYNYGDSVIAESYATGKVTAESQGALPYAGGLSGYNSNKAVIQDSYATGYVSAVFSSTGAAGWTGGIVGSNAKDAVISRCYSLSAVSPPAFMGDDGMPIDQPGVTPGGAAGGIVGHTYFTQYAVSLTKIENCAALNSSLRGNNVHRITGSVADNAILLNNIGWDGMDWTPGPEPAERTANGLDGADCVAKPGSSVYTDTLGWDFASVWKMGGNGYPVLRWQ